jgi:hypothetical protein
MKYYLLNPQGGINSLAQVLYPERIQPWGMVATLITASLKGINSINSKYIICHILCYYFYDVYINFTLLSSLP